MSVIRIAAEASTIILNGYALTSLAEGDFVDIAPVNAATARTNSASGGVNIVERVDAGVTDVTVRVQKLSADDVFLNSLRNQKPIAVIDGSVKTNYSRDGRDSVETYALEGGSLTTQPTDTKNNQDGNAMMEYVIQFRNSQRSL